MSNDNESLIKEDENPQGMIKDFDDITIRFSGMTQSGIILFIGLSYR